AARTILTAPSAGNWRDWPRRDKLRLLARLRQRAAQAGLEPDAHGPQRDRCLRSCAHFIDEHCRLDPQPRRERYRLWPAQRATLAEFVAHRRLVVLKARQLGLSWLALGFALHLMLFVPGTTALFFSKGEREAAELLRRLRGMIERLPDWLRPE